VYGGKNEKSMRCNLGVIITVLIASSMRVGSSNTKEEYERINEEPSLPHSDICSKKTGFTVKKRYLSKSRRKEIIVLYIVVLRAWNLTGTL